MTKQAIFFLVLSLNFGIAALWLFMENKTILANHENMIKKCEAELPRSQHCYLSAQPEQ